MTDTDFASDDSFSAEEQAAWAEMRGEAAPEPQSAPQAAAEPALGAGEPAAAAPAGAPAAAPGEVVEEPDLDGEDDSTKNKGAFVRHGAFHQAREKYKAEKTARVALEAELAQYREKFARGDERLRVLTEAMQARQAPAQPQAEPAKAPDPNEDIFGAYNHLKAELEALKGGVQQETTRQRQEAETRVVRDAYVDDARRFAAAEPTFAAAYNHLYQSRAVELAAAGVPEAQILPQIQAEEMEIAAACRRAGVSPAERVFAIAKARGFVPKAPEPAAEPTPPPAPAETAQQRQERIAAGQKGPGLSLSSAGGAPAGEVTVEMLANMSDEEFARFQKANPAKVRQYLGA